MLWADGRRAARVCAGCVCGLMWTGLGQERARWAACGDEGLRWGSWTWGRRTWKSCSKCATPTRRKPALLATRRRPRRARRPGTCAGECRRTERWVWAMSQIESAAVSVVPMFPLPGIEMAFAGIYRQLQRSGASGPAGGGKMKLATIEMVEEVGIPPACLLSSRYSESGPDRASDAGRQ
eukprot:3003659-Rhodomonas_salina.1